MNEEIIEYVLVDDGNLPSGKPFSEAVMELINQGFQPYGSPYSRKGYGSGQGYSCQALVKYKKE